MFKGLLKPPENERRLEPKKINPIKKENPTASKAPILIGMMVRPLLPGKPTNSWKSSQFSGGENQLLVFQGCKGLTSTVPGHRGPEQARVRAAADSVWKHSLKKKFHGRMVFLVQNLGN